MHVIEPNNEETGKVYFKVSGLRTQAYSDLAEFCANHILHECERELGPYLGAPILQPARVDYCWSKEPCRVEHPAYIKGADWVIQRPDGESILIEEVRNIYHGWRAWNRRNYKPKMGRKAAWAYGSYRAPKTTNEKRQSFRVVEDGEPSIRCRRNMANLTDAWDDTTSHNDSCWKTQYKRKNQYRAK